MFLCQTTHTTHKQAAKYRLFEVYFYNLFYYTMKNYKTIEELLATKKAQKILDENLSSYNDENAVIAVLELNYGSRDGWNFDDLENAVNDIENGKITHFSDMDAYYDYCDETIEFPKGYDYLERYFDYDAFHRDCEYDVSEASNGTVIANR